MSFSEADIEAMDRESDAYSALPDTVRQFLVYFRTKFRERATAEIHQLYEDAFNKLTKHFYENSPWPSAELVAPHVDNDAEFLLLYKELYYRHLFSKMKPSLTQRVEGWNNYCELFDLFLGGSMTGVDLPPSWLWDIIDEFIYQFETWCQYRAKLKSKPDEEIEYLREKLEIWNVTTVLSILHGVVHHSNIISWLLQGGSSEGSSNPDDESFDPSTVSVYRYIGYFAIIGLLRVNTLLGDYRLALMVLEPLDFELSNALFAHVTACHTSVYYYMGFAYIMLRRYEDAVRVFSSAVSHIGRIKQYHTRSYQYEQVSKRNDQMMVLLSLCLALRPSIHVDESVYSAVQEKASDRLARMRHGDTAAFEDVFQYASPKFISPAPPNFNVIDDYNMEAPRLQKRLFMTEVSQQLLLPKIRSYLKLYTSIDMTKLAKFMDIDVATLRGHLHALKHKSWTLRGNSTDPPFSGAYAVSSDVEFYIDCDVVHISNTKVTPQYGEYFISHLGKLEELTNTIKGKVKVKEASRRPRLQLRPRRTM